MNRNHHHPNQHKPKPHNFGGVAEDLIRALNKRELGAYLHKVAVTGSAYIRFDNPNMGSIRIGDHDGYEKYKYKYNIRTDIRGHFWKKQDGIWQFFCNTSHLDKLIDTLIDRKERIKTWPKREGYGEKGESTFRRDNRKLGEEVRGQESIGRASANDSNSDNGTKNDNDDHRSAFHSSRTSKGVETDSREIISGVRKILKAAFRSWFKRG